MNFRRLQGAVSSTAAPASLLRRQQRPVFSGAETEATNSGDACVNDCSVHLLVPELPFGGGPLSLSIDPGELIMLTGQWNREDHPAAPVVAVYRADRGDRHAQPHLPT
jgi:hypothetical protein